MDCWEKIVGSAAYSSNADRDLLGLSICLETPTQRIDRDALKLMPAHIHAVVRGFSREARGC